MGLYSLVNIRLVAAGILFPGWLGLWAIFLTSFFMSVMYPTIFTLGIEGLDRNTKIGGSLIVMAIIGGGVLTPAMGLVDQAFHSIAIAYLVPLLLLCRCPILLSGKAAGRKPCRLREPSCLRSVAFGKPLLSPITFKSSLRSPSFKDILQRQPPAGSSYFCERM